jgi:hypothetical protein
MRCDGYEALPAGGRRLSGFLQVGASEAPEPAGGQATLGRESGAVVAANIALLTRLIPRPEPSVQPPPRESSVRSAIFIVRMQQGGQAPSGAAWQGSAVQTADMPLLTDLESRRVGTRCYKYAAPTESLRDFQPKVACAASTATRLCNQAQGWTEGTTLGSGDGGAFNPNGVVAGGDRRGLVFRPPGRNPVGVGGHRRAITQGWRSANPGLCCTTPLGWSVPPRPSSP